MGIIGRRSEHIEPEVKRAVTSYYSQMQRCQNSNNNRYQYVGARGIEVEYTLREFVTWWLVEILKRPAWRSPTCGRKNHDDHYRFGNIELVERAENLSEMNKRKPYSARFVPVLWRVSENQTIRFQSLGEASRISGVPKHLIQLELDGKLRKPYRKFGFKYARK